MTTKPQQRGETKAQKRLNIRRADYSRMISDSRKNWTGYKRPGSNKK